MRQRHLHQLGAFCLALYASALMVAWSPRLEAQQARSVRDGVFSAAQAARGETLYQASCAMCHGAALTGDAGPPLKGADFMGAWSGQPLAGLFGKISATMPASAPMTLTRAQVVDLLAFLLRANTFPAGATELGATDASLAQIMLPAAPRTAPAAAVGGLTFPASGTLNQVMRGTLFPSSNVLFDVQTQDPGAKPTGMQAGAAQTTARYGNVYTPWQLVDAAAIAIAESGPMLMMPGRRCENGKPVPVDRADWQKYVQGLVDAGRAAYRASQTRSQEKVSDVTNDISDACANCHRVYRDVPTMAGRCTPP